jgi:sugar lactone lactonase YvrE
MTRADRTLRQLTGELVYPESPRWYRDSIWISDVHDYAIKSVGLDGRVNVQAPVAARPAGFGVLPDDSLLVASALDRRLGIFENGRLREVNDLSELTTGLLNDMVVGRDGTSYVGDTGFRLGSEANAPGRIILRRPDGSIHVAAEGLAFPNGMALTDDESVLYVAETFGQRLTAFTVGRDGHLTEPRVVAELGFRPDGICLDGAANVWLAATFDARFVCCDTTGVIVDQIPAPASMAVACVFVGADRSTLALCSAQTSLQDLPRGMSKGRVDVIEVGISGGGRP